MIALVAAACGASPQERARSVSEAARRGGPAAEASILARAGDPSPEVRAAVVVALTWAESGESRAAVLGALDDPSEIVRATAATALGAAGRAEAIPRLAERADSDPNDVVRRRAVQAIARLGPVEGSAAALVPTLDDPDPAVRRVAAEGLAGLDAAGVPGAVEALAGRLAEDPDWEVRVAAATALGTVRLPAAWGPLSAALGDPNEFVRAAASRAAKALTRAGVPKEAPPPEPAAEVPEPAPAP